MRFLPSFIFLSLSLSPCPPASLPHTLSPAHLPLSATSLLLPARRCTACCSAMYDEGYDNEQDTYLQRWRMEDKPWTLTVGDWTETWNETDKMFYLRNAAGVIHPASPSKPEDRWLMLERAFDLLTFRNITGQVCVCVCKRVRAASGGGAQRVLPVRGANRRPA